MSRGRDVTVRPDEAKGEPRVLANRYKIERKLGAGNFGTAFLCKDLKADGDLKVLKEILCGDLAPDETVDAVHEAKLLSKLNHVNIVRFHDSFLDANYFCIVTEYCEGGDLEDRMSKYRKSGRRFDETTVLNWFVQLVMAVKHMHSRRVLHRDLKARNIFLSKDDTVKIGDFGISRMLMGTTDMASTFVGTPYYMSPEALKHEGYNSKSDIWSVGCLLYELCELKHAFEGQGLMGVMYKIVEGTCPEISGNYSKEINSLLKRLLEKDPDCRASASEILNKDFVRKHIERMQTALSVQHAAPDSTVLASRDAQEMSQELSRKWHKEDLQREEEKRYADMTPRERLRLKKMAEADVRAKKMQEAARQQQEENRTIREVRKSMDNMSSTQMRRAAVDADRLQDVGYSLAHGTRRPKTAPGQELAAFVEDEDDSDSDSASGTVHYRGFNDRQLDRGAVTISATEYHGIADSLSGFTLGEPGRHQASHSLRPSSAVQDWSGLPYDRVFNTGAKHAMAPDERPITPLQDQMVYNVEHSSLDFEDGVPADPVLADTYYSQHDDFDDDLDGAEGTIRADITQNNLIKALQAAARSNEGESTLMFRDASDGDAFGPAAREIKIGKMRSDCERRLGSKFRQVYKYLKEARCGPQPKDEAEIMSGLRRLVSNTSDCFLVDQLVFLEMRSG